GGIMGGEDTGVSEATTEVVIECAFFDPDHIARTGQKLNLTSDARSRFERGVDPAFLEDGIAIAARYVVDLCGGTASEVTRAGEPPLGTRSYPYDPARAETLGGLAVPAELTQQRRLGARRQGRERSVRTRGAAEPGQLRAGGGVATLTAQGDGPVPRRDAIPAGREREQVRPGTECRRGERGRVGRQGGDGHEAMIAPLRLRPAGRWSAFREICTDGASITSVLRPVEHPVYVLLITDTVSVRKMRTPWQFSAPANRTDAFRHPAQGL
ncbi:MAG TPA: hypothetical protein DIW80_15410, partial [Gordonia polyisoprenivorans]|nr:hypothetical protein [Gordonia polyisoprenivorans]